MYGVRGANGVIIINTKRGQIGAPSIDIKVEQSVARPTKLPEFIGAADYMELLNELKENKAQLPYSQDRFTERDRDMIVTYTPMLTGLMK